MDVHRPGRTRREYSMIEAPQGADGRRPVCRPWPTGQVPPDQETRAGINQNLSVAQYLQGRVIGSSRTASPKLRPRAGRWM
jgi:hypothetical protein